MLQDILARFDQRRMVGPVAAELEGKIGLDRGADVGRPAVIDGPAAIVVLVAGDLADGLGEALFVARAQHCVQEDVIGFQRGVGF